MKNRSASVQTFLTEVGRFYIPQVDPMKAIPTDKKVAVLIPTYNPTETTFALIKSIMQWHPEVTLVVIDDCTPVTQENLMVINRLKEIAVTTGLLSYLRTSQNKFKAGALNYGIDYVLNLSDQIDVIFTFDDDVLINKETIPHMVRTLYSNPLVGAVCSQVGVLNKNQNMLTRLQALEYHNFNINKLADNGFLKGPLVMQGMLTAFRAVALKQVHGFSTGHLIEDYEITARLKSHGWIVKISKEAFAWTHVPETLEALWKQRVRWISGGLQVLRQYMNRPSVVYQDLVGHSMYLSLMALVSLSLLFMNTGHEFSDKTFLILSLSLGNFIFAYVFSLLTLFTYDEVDFKDVLLKLSVIPELIYSNILSFILLGSYLFVIYNSFFKPRHREVLIIDKPYLWGLSLFQKAGFSGTWGTK